MRRSPDQMLKREMEAARQLLGPGHLYDTVATLPIAQLVPYANHGRTHTDKQIAVMSRSMEAVGFLNPVLATRDGVIIAGHGRVTAAKRLGLTHVPVLFIEGLTADQVRAYRLADNRIAELAGWDASIIELELQHLSTVDLGFTIEAIGWDMPEIDEMLTRATATDDSAVAADADDELVELADRATSREGDVWLLGKHRLACGSALDPKVLSRVMDGKKARQLLQDPPWNIPVTGFISTTGRHREFAMAAGEMSDEEFQGFLDTNLDVVMPHLVDGAILEQFIDWRSVDKVIRSGKTRGLQLINICVWNKTNGSMGSLFRSKHELCVVFLKPGAAHVNNVQLGKYGRYRTNVWDFPGCNAFGTERDAALATHPTAKSVAMIAEAMRDVSHRDDIVLDCFMGSGTAIIAAERTGRVAFGVELDPLYVDAAVRRWEAITGCTATLEGTTLTFAEVVDEREPVDEDDAAPDASAPAIRRRPRPAAAI